MFTRKREKRRAQPYTRLAEIYDYVMRHVDYVQWADYIEAVFARHNAAPPRILDLACGTGSMALELGKRNYRAYGADSCREMLDVAVDKTLKAGQNVEFFLRNLTDLSGLPRVEAALCLYDSMNYLMTIEDVALALTEVHGILLPDGLFVFDVCTETNSLRYFRRLTDKDGGDGFTYVRESFYRNGIQFNRFDIRFKQTDESVVEEHRQRIYALPDILAALEQSPFSLEGSYDGFGFRGPDEDSDRVHFVLRKVGEGNGLGSVTKGSGDVTG
ncbi:MAG: class I SAM-dependent methyltransferase [Gemmatimonadota bacterium]|nr:class I SAM-dependent methyltransferase [Gemmatimonadota bacterium]